MKIGISGDMDKEDLIALGKFLKKRFGYPEEKHINMFVVEGTEGMSAKEVLRLLMDVMESSKPCRAYSKCKFRIPKTDPFFHTTPCSDDDSRHNCREFVRTYK